MLLLLNVNFAFSQVIEEWVARYSISPNHIDGGKSLIVDNFKNIYVTGASVGFSTGYDFVLIKYSSSGNTIWINRYNGNANGSDIPNAIALDSSNNLYVTGESEFNGNRKDFVTIKYNSDGIQQWLARYPGSGLTNSFPTSITVGKFNTIYITGKVNGKYTTIKYNSDGIQQWVAEYPAMNFNDIPWSISVDAHNSVYIAGEKSGNYFTLKYDSNGVQMWESIYNGPYNGVDFANSLCLDSSGNVYVSGSIEDELHYADYTTIKYNNLGEEQWIRRYGGSGNFLDVVESMKVNKFGDVYITGYSTELGQGYNMTTIKYNTRGDTLWNKSYNNGLNDVAFSLELDNFGNVYITGQSDGSSTGFDFSTLKYNSNGEQQWEKRYDYSGQYDDYSSAITVDDYGNVYVTGQSNRDILTIKYSQPTGVNSISLETPTVFKLDQNYPNPFNPETVISYHLQISSEVKLKVYNVLGNESKTLVEEKQNSGSYSVTFDGSGYPSGVYLYRLMVDGNIVDTKRMILLK